MFLIALLLVASLPLCASQSDTKKLSDTERVILARARGFLDPSVTQEEEKSLYNAAMSGTSGDVEYVLAGLKGLGFNAMKQALHAREIPGVKVQVYISLPEHMYLDQAYEPFVDTLKKFPESTEKAVGCWLYQVLDYKMCRVESAIREPWLVQELELLQKYKS